MAKPFPMARTDLMREIADLTGGKTLLAFSRGRDSIAAYLVLRESGLFHDIRLFHLDGCPGMAFVEDSLRYFEKMFGCHIHRLVHPAFYRQLGNCVFQPPERCRIIRALRIHECTRITYDHVRRWLAEDFGWPESETWVATGITAFDSPRRRLHIVKSRARTLSSKQWFPVFDMHRREMLKLMAAHNIELPIDYRLWKLSFDGIDARFTGPLREHLPADYDVLLHWFPLAELDLMRHDMLKGE